MGAKDAEKESIHRTNGLEGKGERKQGRKEVREGHRAVGGKLTSQAKPCTAQLLLPGCTARQRCDMGESLVLAQGEMWHPRGAEQDGG